MNSGDVGWFGLYMFVVCIRICKDGGRQKNTLD